MLLLHDKFHTGTKAEVVLTSEILVERFFCVAYKQGLKLDKL